MKHVVIDLEMDTIRNNPDARRVCKQETIEIGAVMLDENLQEIASFRTYVKPECIDRISSKVKKLTGISLDMLIGAPNFSSAMKMFSNWCLGCGDSVKVYAWSDNDYKQISAEMEFKNYEMTDAEASLYGEEWTDFQAIFDKEIGFERQVSLKMALDMAGISFVGREHTALDDARNTAGLLQVFEDRDLFNQTLAKVKEAMTPTPFGASMDSLIDFSKLRFSWEV